MGNNVLCCLHCTTVVKAEQKTGTNELEYTVDQGKCAGLRCSHLKANETNGGIK